MKKPTMLATYRAISDIVAKGAFFLLTVLAARRLSAPAFGLFALGSTLGWIIGVATDAGLQMHLARWVAQSDGRLAGRFLARWLPLRIGTAVVALAVTAAIAYPTADDSAAATAIFVLVAVYILNSLVEFLNYFYRGLGRTDIESTLTMVTRLAALAVGGGALLWHPSVVGLALSLLVPAVAALWWSLRKAASLSGPWSKEPTAPAAGANQIWRELINDVLPIGAAVMLSALYFRIDVFLIEWWRGAEEVGAYNAVFRVVEALRLFPAAALAVALPISVGRRTLRKSFGSAQRWPHCRPWRRRRCGARQGGSSHSPTDLTMPARSRRSACCLSPFR